MAPVLLAWGQVDLLAHHVLPTRSGLRAGRTLLCRQYQHPGIVRKRAAPRADECCTCRAGRQAGAAVADRPATASPVVSKTAVSKLKVAELRAALKDRGLSTDGLKTDLVARLLEALEQGNPQELQSPAEPSRDSQGAPSNQVDDRQHLPAVIGYVPEQLASSSGDTAAAQPAERSDHQAQTESSAAAKAEDKQTHSLSSPGSSGVVCRKGGVQVYNLKKLGMTSRVRLSRFLHGGNRSSSQSSRSDADLQPRLLSSATRQLSADATEVPRSGAQEREQGDAGQVRAAGGREHYITSHGSTESAQALVQAQQRMWVTWLGTSSGAPTLWRNVSCIALRLPNSTFLVDCGEGTSVQLGDSSIDLATIRKVFITHMHGDHVYGLSGMLQAVSAARRGTELADEPFCVFGPPGIHQMLYTSLQGMASPLSMPLAVVQYVLDPAHSRPAHHVSELGRVRFAHLPPDPGCPAPPLNGQHPRNVHQVRVVPGLRWTIRCEDGLTVAAAQLQHRVPCWGYVMREADQESRVDMALALALGCQMDSVKEALHAAGGQRSLDMPVQTSKGSVALRKLLTPAIPGRKVVLLGDTCDSAAIADLAEGADMVSHEATFARGMEDKADIAQHSTADMAGEFARHINAHDLVLTHFSARYTPTRKDRAQGNGSRAVEAEADVATADGGSDIFALIRQAQQAFGCPRVQAAGDFTTFVVPQHEPQYRLPPLVRRPGDAAAPTQASRMRQSSQARRTRGDASIASQRRPA